MNLQSLENRCLLSATDLDPTFGTAGVAFADISQSDDRARAIAVQTDGRIVVVGSTTSAEAVENIAVARFTAAGQLDSSFSDDGMFSVVATSADEGFSRGTSVFIQSDGKILVGGWKHSSGFTLIRLNVNGTPDSSFGTGGVATIDDVGPLGYRDVLAIRETGDAKILVGGVAQKPFKEAANEPFVAAARYNSNGTLDTSFGDGGTVITSLHFLFGGARMDVQSDGRLVLCGATADAKSAVVRYTAAGELDTTFGSDGVFQNDYAANAVESYVAIKVRDDDKIVVTGWHDVSGGADSAGEVARLTRDGALDTTYGGDGKTTINTSDFDETESLLLMGDGSIFVGGNNSRQSVIFKLKSNGTLDKSWGLDGRDFDRGTSVPDLALASGKLLYVAGSSGGFNDFGRMEIARYGNDRITLSGRVLTIDGTTDGETIHVQQNEIAYSIDYNGAPGSYFRKDVDKIVINCGAGNDTVSVSDVGVPVEIAGGNGNDSLFAFFESGGTTAITLSGGAGNDSFGVASTSGGFQIFCGEGDDFVRAGEGADTISGGAGKDMIYGGAGNDLISGNGGKDRINSGQGNDRVNGGAGDDQVDGGPGTDRLNGNDGNDKLFGGKGNDQLTGGAGTDLLIANAGNDVLFAADGEADLVDGGSGSNSGSLDAALDKKYSIQAMV